MEFDPLKKLLIEFVDLSGWEPTESQVSEVRRLIIETRPSSPDELKAIIYKACDITEGVSLEGIDNSDLNSVLAMASKPPKTR